ncbi:hypothetical protein EDL79_01895 [Ehrlichia ruminantium]|uniref:Uncharacterized protein n=1 Tax=Ehrlichia ruminantium TaxID=779 RepID=A0AAE6Q8U8_EHRRU|nr:hypothetical protein EDL81_01900 [Ehrlichia ruminantium]QGR03339.1 hypothetical protein EDL80_01895 [Ehrlichia ruminantium]QGR04266.1 hypothetical protein EDL79_01895 [Ehrlichia ruminantium]
MFNSDIYNPSALRAMYWYLVMAILTNRLVIDGCNIKVSYYNKIIIGISNMLCLNENLITK